MKGKMPRGYNGENALLSPLRCMELSRLSSRYSGQPSYMQMSVSLLQRLLIFGPIKVPSAGT